MHAVSKSAFKKMKERKKSTVLTFVLLIILLEYAEIQALHPHDLSFFSIDEKELVCIGVGNALDSALDWIYPISDSLNNSGFVETYFEPRLKNSYECSFSKGKPCNQLWRSPIWQVQTFSPRNFQPILDSRWEAFPLLLTKNGSLENKIDIPPEFKLGVSIRASKDAEILLCEGWNPETHPCYRVTIGKDANTIYLKKCKKGINTDSTVVLTKFKAETYVISEWEWKTFSIELTKKGVLTMSDFNTKGSIFNYTDPQPLNVIYLFVTSQVPALWKIHKNDFLYTNVTATSKFGPLLDVNRSEMCIAFKVSMCVKCNMTLFVKENNKETIIANITTDGADFWKSVEVSFSTLQNKIQIYSRTAFSEKLVQNQTQFWAFDSVRECTKKEIKVSRMDPLGAKDIEKVSCQSLLHPEWRPNKQKVPQTKELSGSVTSYTSTSITFSWDSKIQEDIHPYFYVLQYNGHGLCKNESVDLKRMHSVNYYVTSDASSMTIPDLIPFTYYTITFKDPLYARNLTHKTHTISSELPTEEELPQNVTIDVKDTSASIQWEVVPCYKKYGPILYVLQVESKGFNFSKNLFEPKFSIADLTPYTTYTVTIITARNLASLKENKAVVRMYYNFTTTPGISSSVEHLEVYSVDESSVNMRFLLPSIPQGIPKFSMVQYCHPSYERRCNYNVNNLTKCELWDDMYCVQVDNLIRNFHFHFGVSLKNENTHIFGRIVNVTALTAERVPGKPTNLSASIINCTEVVYYCHVNISWHHPYYQNGTIDTFEIRMIEMKTLADDTDVAEDIHGVLKIPHKNYQSSYSHVMKYIPYSTSYNISVQSTNSKYSSEPASIQLNTDHIGNHIDQSPKLVEIRDTSLVFRVPKMDNRLNTSNLLVIVQDYNHAKKPTKNFLNISENSYKLCSEFGESWLSTSAQLSSDKTVNITVGNGLGLNNSFVNKPLEPDSTYCVTFLMINVYKSSQHVVVYHEKNIRTKPVNVEAASSHAYLLFLLLVVALIPGAWFSHKYLKNKRWPFCRKDDCDHIYEYIPNNSISNDVYDTYDTLIHK